MLIVRPLKNRMENKNMKKKYFIITMIFLFFFILQSIGLSYAKKDNKIILPHIRKDLESKVSACLSMLERNFCKHYATS